MASTTFSGPVRSENGFLEKDEAGNWVPVSGGGGGGDDPLAVPLRFPTSSFNSTPALPIINIFGQNLYEYDGTVSSTVTAVTGATAAPGTYSNPVVSIGYTTGFITAAANGVPPSPGPSTAPVVGYGTATSNLTGYGGVVVIDPDGLPSGAMVTGIYIRIGSGMGPTFMDFTFYTDSNDIVQTSNTYYENLQLSVLSDPFVWVGSFLPLASGSSSTNLRVSWNSGDYLGSVPCQFTVEYVVFP